MFGDTGARAAHSGKGGSIRVHHIRLKMGVSISFICHNHFVPFRDGNLKKGGEHIKPHPSL